MDHVLSYIFSFPNVFIYAVSGAIFGAVGGGLGMFIAKKFKSKTASQAVWIGFLMFCITLSPIPVKYLQREVMANKIVDGLSENKLFSAIIDVYPEAKEELKDQYNGLLKRNPSSDQMFLESQKISAEWSNKYIQKSVLSASDSSIYSMIKNDVKILNFFKSKPQICVAYFLGSGGFGKDDLSQDLIDGVMSIKVGIIESSIKNPSFLSREDININDVRDLITSAYKAKGYDIKDFQKLDQFSLLDPKEACEVGFEFDSAIESLGEKKATYVYKSVILLSRRQ